MKTFSFVQKGLILQEILTKQVRIWCYLIEILFFAPMSSTLYRLETTISHHNALKFCTVQPGMLRCLLFQNIPSNYSPYPPKVVEKVGNLSNACGHVLLSYQNQITEIFVGIPTGKEQIFVVLFVIEPINAKQFKQLPWQQSHSIQHSKICRK